MHQARKSAIGEQATAGLAWRAVVSLIVSIADALNVGATSRAWLMITAMHRHLGTKRGDALGKTIAGFGAQSVGPFDEDRAG